MSDVRDPVNTFARFGRLIGKWLLFLLLGIIGLTLLAFGGGRFYYWYTYDRHAANVAFIIKTDKQDCDDDKFPIYILIGNTSSKTLVRATFRLEARRKGRSSNLATYQTFTDDHISAPDKGYANCWAAPLDSSVQDNPRDLEWSVVDHYFGFVD